MRHYFGLDLLRFFAAMLVVLYHLSEFGGAAPSWPADRADAPLGFLSALAWFGWVGVSIFFVLSGFIISASAAVSSAPGFLKNRAIRLVPTLWVSALLSLIIRAAAGEPLGELLASFLRTIVLSPKGPYIDGVVWSLVIEAIFYLLVWGIICLAPRFGGMRRCLTAAALALGALSAGFTLVQWLANHAGAGALPGLLGSFAFDVLLLRHGAFFAVGMLLFQMIERRPSAALLFALGVFTIASCLQIAIAAGAENSPVVPIVIWLASTGFTYASVKYGEVLFDAKHWQFTRPIGLMTYPLYLNHFVFGQALIPLLVMGIEDRAALLAGALAIILGVAWLIAQYPERWLQGWARAYLSRKPLVPALD